MGGWVFAGKTETLHKRMDFRLTGSGLKSIRWLLRGPMTSVGLNDVDRARDWLSVGVPATTAVGALLKSNKVPRGSKEDHLGRKTD